MPNFQTKHGGRAYATPHQMLAYRIAQGRTVETPPLSMVISWQRGVLDRVRDSRNVSEIAGPAGGVLELSGGVGFVYLPPGAPLVAIALEELAAMGTRTVVGLGTAGAIAPGLAVGDVVVCSAALRDDGTSHHYERDGRWAAPDEKVTEHLRAALPGAAFGSTWTTDAPYRETIEEIAAYQGEGVLTVDMGGLSSIHRWRFPRSTGSFRVLYLGRFECRHVATALLLEGSRGGAVDDI